MDIGTGKDGVFDGRGWNASLGFWPNAVIVEEWGKAGVTFRDRIDAGRQLGEYLKREGVTGAVLFAIPSGGIPVAMAAAEVLKTRFDIVVVKKLGLPGSQETAFGAVAFDGTVELDSGIITQAGLREPLVNELTAQGLQKVREVDVRLRGGRPFPCGTGQPALVIDDGLATGNTALVAVAALTNQRWENVGVAVPVAPSDSALRLAARLENRFYAVVIPDVPFFAVGSFYEDFHQLEPGEMQQWLRQAAARGLYPIP